MTGAQPRVLQIELVRASPTMSLLRVDIENGPANRHDVALLVGDRGGRRRLIASLPVPGDDDSCFRAAFGLTAGERPTNLSVVVGGVELPIALPPERSREDAVQTVALQRARERLAELEELLAEREAAGPATAADNGAPDADAERLTQQLAEHRLLRAQLTKELKSVRAQTDEMQSELQEAVGERERLLEELEKEREGGAAERGRLSERLQRAHQRVEYLERRLVEIQAQSLPRHHRA